ncbi:sigma-70 family RNA polymerase sigma factor [Brevibacillus dissolubilis]|uniref:sigma-70 family RNA polymerase sigma factor n=1 Tax=Brevibacillus dissolubilis TaxID=1844116 RepID=UPI001116860B|nr:sigma-70 family RNA polymerase sigma factor [Brevibacillus dissolubilis]
MTQNINLLVTDAERSQTKLLLKAYPSMKAAVDIFTDRTSHLGVREYNEFDYANMEGRGTRGDIDGRGKRGDVVGNTLILREERPVMIAEYEEKLRAVDKALTALPEMEREILTKCFLEQKRDKQLYEFVLNIPKSTYDYHKKNALTTMAFILKAAGVIS